MVESDRSEADEGSMDTLELSSDSIDSAIKKKRPRMEENVDKSELSLDSMDFPIKKKSKMEDCVDEAKDLSSKRSEILKENNDEAISDKNSTDEYNTKKEKHIIHSENGQNETSLCKSNEMKEGKKLKKLVKQENKNKSSLNMDEDSAEIKINDKDVEDEAKPFKELVEDTTVISIAEKKKKKKEAAEEKEEEEDDAAEEKEEEENDAAEEKEEEEDDAAVIEEQEDKKNGIKKEHIIKSDTTDTEVVDGLELSVECASEKEEPSSENEDEKDAKPRPKTIIVKAEPNKSELECSSSEEENDSQEATDIPENKSERKKRRGARTSFNKIKGSGSEDSRNNNSDEDYSPRMKRKMKKSPAVGRSTKRLVESRRGRNGNGKKNSYKKGTQYTSDDKNADTTLAEKADKLAKNEMEEKLSEKELSEKESSADKSESDNNSEDEERPTKGKRTSRSNVQKDNKQIQRLKRYLSIAGVRIKYNALTDCKNNASRIRHLKELLEKNGVNGRPTLEKCKRAREENERMREASELDVSNIISEGRVTRARRNMDNGRKAISSDTPPRHREARNSFKRIQTVIDSDSE
ncbi:uncharacterized protein DDB_G0286299 isoform X2 [Linepithema humile]|uniref:uncharacterized protein DDB_G0286299 isoform X2 n=1 Tax=Linepithema humile TaxID=83485 RepID=UPI00351DCA75